MMKIKTKDHPKVKRWKRILLGQDNDSGLFLCNHFRVITYALKFGLVEELIAVEGTSAETMFPGEDRILITEEIRNEFPMYSNQFALIRRLDQKITSWNRILLIDSCSGESELGTLMRTSLCFGFDGILLTGSSVNPWSLDTVRAAQEAVFKIPVEKMSFSEAVRTLKEKGCRLVTAGNRKAVTPEQLPLEKQMAVVISGAGGTAFDLMTGCDIVCRTDLCCDDPFSMTANAAILMYACRNLRGDGLC